MQRIMKMWQRYHSHPLARMLISKILGFYIPYTGSISPRIEDISPGYARVRLRDRRRVRNHLNSVHAIALANLGEFSTGLVILSKIASGQRFVLRELKVSYLKKARGPIVAQAKLDHDQGLAEDQEILSELFDLEGNLVCEVRATWRIGSVKAKG